MRSSESWHSLSHGQEALWFLWKLVPQTWAYNIVLPAGVRGPLDAAALERALQRLVDRHPALRTEFREENGKPLQRARESHRLRIEHVDAAGWSDTAIRDAITERAHQPFDLESDATMRVTLFRRAADHHALLLAVHHIVSDLWSLIVLMDELRQLYAAENEGRVCALPPLPLPYSTFADEQRRALDGPEGERLWNWWREELSGELPALDLPTDHPRPSMQSFRGGTITRRIDADLTRKLKLLAGKERVTPYMALLAAYQILLGRFSGQESFVVGSPTSGREREEYQSVVGDFVNMVPLRADLSGTPTFRELLARVRTRVLGTMQHQAQPFSVLVDRLHTARDLSRSPIFQTTFVLQKFHRFPELSRVMIPGEDEPSIPFAGLTLEPIALAQQDGQFDLNLEMKEDEQGRLAAAWKYSADLFEGSTIARIAAHFETLLADIVANPDKRIADLRLLTDDESRAAIEAGEADEQPLPAASVAALIDAQIAQRGDAIALSCGDESLTYRQLGERATKLASALVRRGVGPDRIVALLLPRGIDFIVAMLAVSKAGGAFLPLDIRHPAARTRQIVEGSGAVLVLEFLGGSAEFLGGSSEFLGVPRLALRSAEELRGTSEDLRGTSEELRGTSEDLRGTSEELRGTPEDLRGSSEDLRGPGPDHLAYLMYTSGSTGAPKGVMVEHRGMVNHVLAKLDDLGMTERDVLAQTGPPTFDIVVWQCLAPLVRGGRVVVFPDEVAEDPARLLEETVARGVTVLQLVPSMLRAILDEEPVELPSLRWMVPTGEALPTELCRRWLARYPRIPLLNTYGSTECSDDQCHYVIRRLAAADESVAVASIGTPIPNMTAHVLDASLQPVPVGVVGELYIGGLGVGRGYVNDPERTAASFIPDPFSKRPGARLYRTRDLARRRAAGNLDFLGRTDHVIKLRGFRIEPGEIEAALMQHPAIAGAAVVARDHPAGERVLVAYVVMRDVTDSDIRQFVAERVPQYMVPTTFCMLDKLPLTSNGKLDMKALPAPQWQYDAEIDLVAPRTPAEERIAAIWSEVLGLARIGVTQDFFAIGGDSIRSIQIVARCKRAGLNVRPSDLFQHSTIAALAALSDRMTGDETDAELAALEVSQEHLDLAFGQVAFDDD
jgi:amino acid adenylation domain-containing protein